MTVPLPALAEIHSAARSASSHFRLPFQRAIRHGHSGNWLGVGVGSSIDFQDHREYVAGDDPRYIDWRAYARTGVYSLKLYREEVTPKVDLVLDTSNSMFFEPLKARRTLEIFYFIVESALRAHASLRCYFTAGSALRELELEEVLGHSLNIEPTAAAALKRPCVESIPFRSGAIRAVVSDLLFPEQPRPILGALCAMRSQGVVFAPFTNSECDPDWDGNTLFIECEENTARKQWIDSEVLRSYRESYERHFRMWREECSKHQIMFARLSAEQSLEGSLEAGGLRSGAVELCK